ncbi:hypothetical protein NUU61_009058 [Penicillium alfredii]|uniref:Uncharacterized protein n=1 Tax=Penicillium alfredii TaxID=1506179 RepID=A0A9W9JWJ7_9EURO|nr:uncharacterized protein NUU61_009058 [Penicillium alfredii]KAJ5084479.1 hypothetical protein NUU61_009058 [Penicillium alfredii]
MYPDDIDDFPFYHPEPRQILERLPDFKPGVLHVFGSESALSSPSTRLQRTVDTGTGVGGSAGASKERAKELVLSCGHLVPMERVQETAQTSADFIDSELAMWEIRTSRFLNAWAAVPHHERVAIDEQWNACIGSWPQKERL